MSTMKSPALPAPHRAQIKRRVTPGNTGQPDPRPVTEYKVTVSTVAGNTRLTIQLAQPCVIRQPAWGFIDCEDGSAVFAPTVKVVDNTTFYFEFDGALNGSVALVDVPYQDMQVQNFQGGFVHPGGQWFRTPVL